MVLKEILNDVGIKRDDSCNSASELAFLCISKPLVDADSEKELAHKTRLSKGILKSGKIRYDRVVTNDLKMDIDKIKRIYSKVVSPLKPYSERPSRPLGLRSFATRI